MSGVLFLVVGPSGSGKDTLIQGARARLAEDARFSFPRRVITRPEEAGGEPHEAVDAAQFAACSRKGGFLFQWDAHDMRYGIKAEVQDDLARGCSVVINVSRSVVALARARFARRTVLHITAPPETLAQRLLLRGREDGDQIARRLARTAEAPIGADVIGIVNGGSLEEGLDRFIAVLHDGIA